jgi:uncharacterized repeat protein (TIGR03803 family)
MAGSSRCKGGFLLYKIRPNSGKTDFSLLHTSMKNLFTVLLTMVVSLAVAQNDTWLVRQDYTGEGRLTGSSFSIGTKIYAGLGLDGDFEGTADFQEYDIASNTWTPKGDFDGGVRFGATSFSINGKGYICFGSDMGAAAYKDVWEYTPSTDSWEKKGDFPGLARAGAHVFVVNNKAYIGGGQDVTSTSLNDLWVFDPAGYTWTQLQSLPGTPRIYAAAFAIGTKGYVGTGLDADDVHLTDFWEYNTVSDQWTRKADHPRQPGAGIGFATATRGYVGLGQSTELYSYYPAENVWVKEADYPQGPLFLNASAAFAGGKAYVGPGLNSPVSPAFYSYTPGTDQSITFGSLAAKTFGNTPFVLIATASSSLAVSYTSSNTLVATISGSTVTITGVGATIITANQAGNGTYDAALPVEQTLTVNKANQTISFSAPGGKNMGDAPFDLTATATSSLPVSYVSSNTAVATISGATLTIVGSGTTTITASQPGNTNYNAATSVDRDLVVSKLNQAITFGALGSKTTAGAPFNLTATASSGLPVSYSSSNTAVATITGSTVTLVGGGTTTITASQGGNATYNAATSIDQDLTVTKGTQGWLGSLPTTGGYGNNITVTLQLSSGLPYTLTSSDESIATVALSGTSYVISPKGIGSTTLTASHAGNVNFEPAPTTIATLVISKGTQTITIDDISPMKYGGQSSIPIIAESSSGLPVTFDPLPPIDPVSIHNNIVWADGAYNGIITARVAGNDFYLAAEKAINLVISKADATISMDPFGETALSAPAFGPVVNTLPIWIGYTLSSTNPAVATIVAGKIVIVGKGTTNIFAVTNSAAFFSAASVFRTLVVKDDHTVTFAELPVKTIGDAPFELTATASSGTGVTFVSGDPGVATVEGNTVTITGVGQTMISAVSGNATYTSKTVGQLLIVKNVGQTPEQQGQFYGILADNTLGNAGSIYKTNNDGAGLTIVKAFRNGEDAGTEPRGTPVLATNGKFYGFTSKGGEYGAGVLFEYDPVSGEYQVKHHFAWNDNPVKTWIATPNGKIYGAKSGKMDDENGPVIFEFDVTASTFTKKKSVTETMGNVTDIFTTSNGKIYLAGTSGTAQEHRVFAEYDPATNSVTKKAQLAIPGSGTDMTGSAEASNGKVYGTTTLAGANNEGVIFEFDPVAGTAAVKLDLPKANFNTTTARGFMRASNGKLYGMAAYGGPDQVGYVYEYKPDLNTMTILAYFPKTLGVATGQLVEAPNGRLYGTDNSGNAGGGLYEFDPATSQLRHLFVFNTTTGIAAPGNLAVKEDKLYGLTSRGGHANHGTFFEFDPATRAISVKINFQGKAEGFSPMPGFAQMGGGKMYGVTRFGGANSGGTIFEFDATTDEYKKLFDFNNNTGVNPQTPLLAGINGKLYGSTRSANGGAAVSGTLFEFDPQTSAFKTIWYMSVAEGNSINHQLAQSKTGKLYGMMAYGGANSQGVLFELDLVTRAYRRLVDFSPEKGVNITAAPMIASNGKIYGTTREGGANNLGVLFEYDLVTDTYSVKHNFSTGTGTRPECILLEVDGKLWGMTTDGAPAPNGVYGVVFQYDLATSTYTNKARFESANSYGKFLMGANGKLYGLTNTGGRFGTGVIVEYDMETDKITQRSELPFYAGLYNAPVGFLVQTARSMKKDQTVTINPIEPKVLGQPAFTPTAATTSGLAVVFSAGSSHITVATNGTVTLAQAGKATLKANQAGNASYAPAPEAQIQFCINPAPPAVTFTNNASGNVILSSTSTAGNQWYKDGTAISGAVNGTYEANTVGVYTVGVTVDGCASELSAAVPIVVTGDVEATTSIILYPNPVHDRLYIMLPGGNQKKVTLLQTDGKIAEEHETSALFLEVDVRSYATGLYLVHVRDENGSHPSMKFIKK